jgi:6-pyruvoyltetrahydropterin/6-carboxytetrahydropterin synthase
MFELVKAFRFEAAHSLPRTIDADASRRIHGHSYQVEVAIKGDPNPLTGMVVDLGELERVLNEARDALDHRLLDDIPHLGLPTMENLSAWIWAKLHPACPGLSRVTVRRRSLGESCTYFGPTVQE